VKLSCAILRRLLVAGLLLMLIAGPALADRLVLLDGRDLKGQILDQDEGGVTFGVMRKGKLVIARYGRDKIKLIVPESTAAEAPRLVGPGGASLRGDGPRPKTDLRRIVVLIDRSSSMSRAGRVGEASKRALAMIGELRAVDQVQIYAFAERVDRVLSSYRNATDGNRKLFEASLRRITANTVGRTLFSQAFRAAASARPTEIHLFTDGVPRSVPGWSDRAFKAQVLGLHKELGIGLHVTLIQLGPLAYLGGEPFDKARADFGELCKATGGKLTVLGRKDTVRAKLGARIEVLDGDKLVESVVVGKRYRLRVVIDGLLADDACYEYVVALPMLAQSVDKSGAELQAGRELALAIIGDDVRSVGSVKLVSAGSSYARSSGYLGVKPGGKLTFSFDALGLWVKRSLPVLAK